MKTFIAFLHKEFLHILRDRRTLLVLFGMPVAQIILFGYAINTEVKEAQVAILDQSRDVRSTSLVNALFASHYFVDAERLDRPSDIERVFKAGNAKMVVDIGPDFARRFEEGRSSVALIADASDPNVAKIVTGYGAQMIAKWTAGFPGKAPPQVISMQPRLHYNPEMKSVFLFVPGVITPAASPAATVIGFIVEPGSNTSVIARLRCASFLPSEAALGLNVGRLVIASTSPVAMSSTTAEPLLAPVSHNRCFSSL